MYIVIYIYIYILWIKIARTYKRVCICMFAVVNFDALAEASDFRIRGQVVFLCWMQDFNPGSLEPNLQQTECPLTNRLNYRGSSWKLELDSPSLWSASIQPTQPHCLLAFAPGSGDIHVVVNFDALAQARDFRIERRQVVSKFLPQCYFVVLSQENYHKMIPDFFSNLCNKYPGLFV